MTSARAPLRRFVLHSLWLVLPFCALLGLDSNTRRSRTLESAFSLL